MEDCGARRGSCRYEGDKVEWAEAIGGPPEAAREADKANGTILGTAEYRGGMNKPVEASGADNGGGMQSERKASGGLSDYTWVS